MNNYYVTKTNPDHHKIDLSVIDMENKKLITQELSIRKLNYQKASKWIQTKTQKQIKLSENEKDIAMKIDWQR